MIANIEWRSGDKKIKTLTRTSNAGNKSDMEFVYNPMGQRILKIEKTRTANVLDPESSWKYTYYAYDANGQVMATYAVKLSSTVNHATLTEQNIYGASRLGMRRKDVRLYENGTSPYTIPDVQQNTLGNIAYEITNYLGNVNVVISDRKLWVPTSSAFKAVVLSRTDYFPFGMEISSRTSNSDNYRFGYQNQEKDNEVSGNGNSYTAEFWQYDSRLGRRWNVDPVVKYHESPYACFANNPIWFIDPSGADTLIFDFNKNLVLKEGGENSIFVDVLLFKSSITNKSLISAQKELYKWIKSLSKEQKKNLKGENINIKINLNGQVVVYIRKEFNVNGIKDYLGTVVGESTNNVSESEGIGAVILNRLDVKNSELTVDGLNKVDGGIVARPGKLHNEITESTLQEIKQYKMDGYGSRIQGAFQAIQNSKIYDISKGAHFWENNISYSQSSNYFNIKVEDKIFKETKILGGSTFFKYNPENEDYGERCWP